MRKSLRENTAGRCTDCRGAQKICWRQKRTGQRGARADLPERGRLRAGPGCDLWSRRTRPDGARRCVQLGRASGLEKIARGLFEGGFRAQTRAAARRKGRARENSRGTEEAGQAKETARCAPVARGIRPKI